MRRTRGLNDGNAMTTTDTKPSVLFRPAARCLPQSIVRIRSSNRFIEVFTTRRKATLRTDDSLRGLPRIDRLRRLRRPKDFPVNINAEDFPFDGRNKENLTTIRGCNIFDSPLNHQ